MDKFQRAKETHCIQFFNRKEYFDGSQTKVQHQCASCKKWFDIKFMKVTKWMFGKEAVIECQNCT